MTDKRFAVDIPDHSLTGPSLMLTKEEAKQHMARCEEILAEAEKLEAKVWDFGMWTHQTTVRIFGAHGWSNSSDPHTGFGGHEGMHTYGNLKDIVENQGPIVIGMSLEDAKRRLNNIKNIPYPLSHSVRLRGYLEAALKQYEEGAK